MKHALLAVESTLCADVIQQCRTGYATQHRRLRESFLTSLGPQKGLLVDIHLFYILQAPSISSNKHSCVNKQLCTLTFYC